MLLKPGRTYEEAVKAFQPYTEIKERVDGARSAAAKLLEQSLVKKRKGYFYVHNRLEGSAPLKLVQ